MKPSAARYDQLRETDRELAREHVEEEKRLAEAARAQKIKAMVERAGDIAKNSGQRKAHETTTFYTTPWIDLDTDQDTKVVTQVQLERVDKGPGILRALVTRRFDKRLSFVSLNLRLSNPETGACSGADRPVLFVTGNYIYTSPTILLSTSGADANYDGEPVSPDTADWQEINTLLTTLEQSATGQAAS